MKAEGHPAPFRVRKRSDFEQAYATGKKRVGDHCVLFVRTNDGPHARLGVTATKKLGGAVRRNRARRLVREAFRRIRTNLPAGYDYVVVARKNIFNTNSIALEAELGRLISGGAR